MGTKIKAVDPLKTVEDVMEQLPKGAFLTVKSKHHLNTMTIGWGTVGIVWSRPVFVVAVRTSRYTFKLIEQAPDFTVSVPIGGECKQELAFCGSRSGKDVDKFTECDLKTVDGQNVASPRIDVPGVHFECKTLLRTPISPDLMSPDLSSFYPGKDYHTIYYGDILACVRQTG